MKFNPFPSPPPREGNTNHKEDMALKEELQKLREIARSGEPDAEERYKALSDEITSRYTSPEEVEMIGDFLLDSYKELNAEADDLLRQVEKAKELRRMKEIIPVSYIARHYFGRSAAWLQQRLYGYKVRGRVYTLSADDRRKFDAALQDIARQISSFSIA